MSDAVQIQFDCMPLRSIGRLDIPLDASPRYRQRCLRIKHAIEAHGSHNTYYLYNARCHFHLTNRDGLGEIEYRFEGTVLTDPADEKTVGCDLDVELTRETCEWLTEPIVDWFKESVSRAVVVEFDRYIAAGDLQQAHDRADKLRAETDANEGFVGMFL